MLFHNFTNNSLFFLNDINLKIFIDLTSIVSLNTQIVLLIWVDEVAVMSL